jgi:DNA-binding transcriptional MerR regulator
MADVENENIENTENDDVTTGNDSSTPDEGLDILNMSDEDFTEAVDNGELNTDTDSKDSSNSEESSDEDHSTEDTSTNSAPVERPRKRKNANRDLSEEEQAEVDQNIENLTRDLTDEDYKKAYKDLLQPLWARGHNFTPRNMQEVKTLMSQGVDYLYKTQQLAQHRKQIELLQREGISNDELTFLIDLKKKDPEAIKKYFADGDLNPYDVDVTEEPNYQPKTHMVDDETLALRDGVNDLMQKPDGRECYDTLVRDLDKASQDYFLKEPQLLQTFYDHQHINAGNNKSLYTYIKDEIDHEKALGRLPQNMPFLDAYRTVGDNLYKQLGQAGNQPSNRTNNSYNSTAPEVHQRLGRTRNGYFNDRVRSAGVSPKTKSSRSNTNVNPFDMPDDEFLKQFDGRL